MNRNVKRKVTIGVTSLAAAAFAGGAYAATQDTTNPRQAFLSDAAKRLHVTPGQLSAALTGAFEDQLRAAVAAGKITQAQANAIRQRAQRNGAPPLGLGLLHPLREFRSGGFGVELSAAASYLGISQTQLMNELTSGKSLAQIAKSRNKPVAGLRQAMLAAATARFDKLAASGAITRAEEQRILSRLSSRLDERINQAGDFPRLRGRFGAAAWPAPPPGPPDQLPALPPEPPNQSPGPPDQSPGPPAGPAY